MQRAHLDFLRLRGRMAAAWTGAAFVVPPPSHSPLAAAASPWPAPPFDDAPDATAISRLPPALECEGITWDHAQLVRSTCGQPSIVYGPRFARYDSAPRVSRLPQPPYLLMSRVVSADPPAGALAVPSRVTSAYVVPHDAWYFASVGAGTLPICVLMEILLQPCGWLALFQGFFSAARTPVRFRNLDGRLTQHESIAPHPDKARVIMVRCALLRQSQLDDTTLLTFAMEATIDGRPLADVETEFGFFPDEALASQVGLGAADFAWTANAEPDNVEIDIRSQPDRFHDRPAGLPKGRLQMLDRITGYWPSGGAARLGYIRVRQDVQANAWYFDAHFFQDPVQPGSLGVEAMVQALQALAILDGTADGAQAFDACPGTLPLTWKYRGQILPTTRSIRIDLEVVARETISSGVMLVARGALWADDRCIYKADDITLLVHRCPASQLPTWRQSLVSLQTMPWLDAHRPNYTIAVMPLMGMLELVAADVVAAHPFLRLAAVEDFEVRRWFPVETPVRTRVSLKSSAVADDYIWMTAELEVWRESSFAALSRFETVAVGRFLLSEDFTPPAPPLAALEDARQTELPYATGAMFHGPCFQVLREVAMGRSGASGVLSGAPLCKGFRNEPLVRPGGLLAPGSIPVGVLNPKLLDGALHPIPHDRMTLWFADASPDSVGYPSSLRRVAFHGPTPRSGDCVVEVRAGRQLQPDARFFTYDVQISSGGVPWTTFEIVTVCFPKSDLVAVEPRMRRALMRGDYYALTARLARREGGRLSLTRRDVAAANWLPGSVEHVFGLEGESERLLERIVVKEAVAVQAVVPPRTVEWDGRVARSSRLPWTEFTLTLEVDGDEQAQASAIHEHFDALACARAVSAALGVTDASTARALAALVANRIGRVVGPAGGRAGDWVLVIESRWAAWSPLLAGIALATGDHGAMLPAMVRLASDAENPSWTADLDAGRHLLFMRLFRSDGTDRSNVELSGQPRLDVRMGFVNSHDYSLVGDSGRASVQDVWNQLQPHGAVTFGAGDADADLPDPYRVLFASLAAVPTRGAAAIAAP
jgi:3-hydroxymyristoyl/3-hydroxydecanoyl-(acyl carrier protein) dehydratase